MSLLNETRKYFTSLPSEKLHQVFLEHFPYILKNNLYEKRTFESVYALVYKGDFHGLLNHLGVTMEFHRVVTEFNGLHSSLDYDGTSTEILIPNGDVLLQIKKKAST